MRKLIAFVLGVAVSATCVGCGDKGGGAGGAAAVDPKSPVGTWKADMSPIVGMLKPMLEMATGMLANAASPEAKAAAEKNVTEAKEKIAAMEKAKIVLVINKDGTCSMDMDMPGEKPEQGTGVWKLDGEKLTITQKTKNGKPVEKDDAKDLEFKDGKLKMNEGPVALTFTR